MRIAITGAAGFISSHISDAYIAAGHDVLVIDDLSTGFRHNLNPKATFAQADIRTEAADAALRDFKPDILNHHAAQMDVRRSVSDPRFDAEVNLLGLINLLESGRKVGLKKVIFASSGGAAYGEQDVFPAPESHRTAPASPYGVAKISSELYLECYRQMYGIPFIALRYANVYGPRQNPHGEAGVVAIFCQRTLKKDPCTIYGDGGQTRDFVFVKDVVRANVLALDSKHIGPVNIGTGVETDINQLYSLIAKSAGFATLAAHAAGKPGEQRRSSIDASKAAVVLGWKPQVALEQGIAETVDFFRTAAK